MFLPKSLYHTSKNPFHLYGFHYKTLAHWFVVQNAAAKGKPFQHFFDMPVEDLPTVAYVPVPVIDEGIEAMFSQNNIPDIRGCPSVYAISDPILGIGTTKIRLEYGDKKRGRNLYGKAIERVLKRRKTFK